MSAFVARMQDRIDTLLRRLVPRETPVALLNFPNHQNPGDNAVWLGALAALRRIGADVRYTCTWSAFSPEAMRRAIGDGPVLLNGGGNFGDLYAGQQDLRETVLDACRDRAIVQLPQSIAFRTEHGLERMRRLCATHPDFTLIVRERRSYDLARRWFDVPTHLCPDLAFALGPTPRARDPSVPVLAVRRWDGEMLPRPIAAGVPETDWIKADPADGLSETERRVLALNRRLVEFVAGDPARAGRRARALSGTFAVLARAWLREAVRLISSAEVLITDRLHAHVFAILLGIPNVVLDNSYGKVRSTFETWTAESGIAAWADDAAGAVSAATELRRRAGR